MKQAYVVTLLLSLLATTGAADTGIPKVTNAVSPVPDVVASGRLDAADIPELRDAGIRHVIDLTLDTETPDFDEATAVRDAGLSYSNLPIRGAADLTVENVRAFDRFLRGSDRPVLIHCSSGNRVGAMAALRAAWIQEQSLEEAVAIGKAWGLKDLESEVRKRIEANTKNVELPDNS